MLVDVPRAEDALGVVVVARPTVGSTPPRPQVPKAALSAQGCEAPTLHCMLEHVAVRQDVKQMLGTLVSESSLEWVLVGIEILRFGVLAYDPGTGV